MKTEAAPHNQPPADSRQPENEKPQPTDKIEARGKVCRKDFVTWCLRLIVGCVFVFSGFVKGIDPWGTLYKFDDYLAVMGLNLWPNLVLVGAFALCAVEFLCGIFLVTGCFRRSSAVLAAMIMAVMLPLTLWIAVSNPVADCGCFGDAYVISNWATFWKNVALSAGVAWLVVHNRRCHWLVTPALQWIAFVASASFIVVIELFGYMSQPLLDFRPYPVGETITDAGTTNSEEPEYVFIYEKEGERKEFSIDEELPDEADGWTFVDRRELKKAAPVEETVDGKNLRIWSKDGREDVTEEALSMEGKELIITMPDLHLVSPATTWKLNSLYEWSLEHDVAMIAVVSGNPAQIADWEDLSMASYPIFTAEDTSIKAMVRGNPGVVYLVDGIVEWKSTLAAINIDDFMSPGTSNDAESFGIDNAGILHNITYIFLAVMAALIVLSFIPCLKKIKNWSIFTRGGKVRREG